MSTKGLYPGLFRPNQNSRLRRWESAGNMTFGNFASNSNYEANIMNNYAIQIPSSVGAIRICLVASGGNGGIDATSTGNPGSGGSGGGVAWNLIIPIHGPSIAYVFFNYQGTSKIQIADKGIQGTSFTEAPLWSIECLSGNQGNDAASGPTVTSGGSVNVYYNGIVYATQSSIQSIPTIMKPFLNGFISAGSIQYDGSSRLPIDVTGT